MVQIVALLDGGPHAGDTVSRPAELMEGPVGYDLSHAMWKADGWKEMKELRKKLENLKELRDLVRALGRASGKGPKRRAPEEARCPPRCLIRHLAVHCTLFMA